MARMGEMRGVYGVIVGISESEHFVEIGVDGRV